MCDSDDTDFLLLMPLSQKLGGTVDSAYNSLSSQKTLSCNNPDHDSNELIKNISDKKASDRSIVRSSNNLVSDSLIEYNDKSDSLSPSKSLYMSNHISISRDHKKQLDEHKLIAEIDNYFHTYLNNSSYINERMDSSGSTGFSPKKAVVPTTVMQLSDLKTSIADSDNSKHYELNEVGKLLNEMEKTQYEIEGKLKSRESRLYKPLAEKYTFSNAYQSGDNISSVPDLGFGLRDMCYNDKSKNAMDYHGNQRLDGNHKDPVIEEPCVKSRINPLGFNASYNGKTSISDNIANIKFHSYPKINLNSSTRDGAENITTKLRHLAVTPHETLDTKSCIPNEYSDDTMPRYGKYVPSKTDSSKNNHSIGNSLQGFDELSSTEEKVNEMAGTASHKKKRMPPRRFGNRVVRGSGTINSRCTSSSGFDIMTSKSRSQMMSLSDLWNNDNANNVNDSSPRQLLQKLEEEQCKRQHCEQQIHELQRKVLEQQEKLAVAIRVDKEKDKAIGQMHAGWKRLAAHWTELEEQRNALASQLESSKSTFNTKTEEMNKKKERWDKEMSQALDLAAGYKEKCESIASERDQLVGEMRSKIEQALAKLSEAEKEKMKCKEENRILLDKLAENEINSEQITLCERLDRCLNFLRDVDKQLISEYELKLKEVETKLTQMEGEVSVLREQKDHANAKWKDEKARLTLIEQQKNSLQSLVEELKTTEKSLKEELKNSAQRLELEKIELRSIFQSQLEAVVKEKVKEFQGQLDSGLASLNAQHISREKDLAQQTAQECGRLVERHRLEIHNLEQKHRADLKMMHNRLLDIEKEKIELKMKLDKETRRRAEMAQKLHGVMESNWKQALQIISEGERKKKQWSSQDERKLAEDGSCSSQSGEAPFNVDSGQLTYRMHADGQAASTSNQSQPSQLQLKRYIQMLLERAPGHPVEDLSCLDNDTTLNSGSLADSQSSWAKFMNLSSDNRPTSENSKPEPSRKLNGSKSKQPWK
ncbi:interaptin isoform X2 [Nilaparvata lugens]|uniref:interaptin isoform X2 n=1 Tax=Nilaparvata lugens TaxID=108931 RepID=UPI00193EA978|nr:interaptin isoform X2 [Nilaparvata lugens]